MNDQYSEEEAKLVNWFKDNRNNLIIGILLGVSIIIGFKYYNDTNVTQQYEISYKYEKAVSKYKDSDFRDILALSDELELEHPSNIYTGMTNLYVSKILHDDGKYNEAILKLDFIMNNNESEEIKMIAIVRTSRILVFLKEYEKARSYIEMSPGHDNNPIMNEILGDIELAKNNIIDARKYYKSSLNGNLVPNKRKIIENKLNSIN